MIHFPFGDWRDLCCSSLTHPNNEKTYEISPFAVSEYDLVYNKQQDIRVQNLNTNTKIALIKDDAFKISKSSQTSHDLQTLEKIERIFKIEKNCKKTDYSKRRDVINKAVIRYFFKYLSKFVKQIIFRKKDLLSFDILTERINKICSSIKAECEIFSEFKRYASDWEISQFIFWIVWKNQNWIKKQIENKQIFKDINQMFDLSINGGNEASTIMENILKGYSHSNLQRFFENKTLRVLFRKFMNSESDNFLSKTQSCKKAKTLEALRDFEYNMNLIGN